MNALEFFFKKQQRRCMGVVLCGGKSSRNGKDKGLLKIGDTYWAEKCASILSSTVSEVIFSVNEKQYPIYTEKFHDREIILDSNEISGPISGILSSFSAFRIYNFLVLPCDMIDMAPEKVKQLFDFFQKNPNHDFYVYKHGDIIYPFCGIYTSQGLSKIYDLYYQGYLEESTIVAILEKYDSQFLPLEGSSVEIFAEHKFE